MCCGVDLKDWKTSAYNHEEHGVRTYSMTLRTGAIYEPVLVMADISSLMVDESLEGSPAATRSIRHDCEGYCWMAEYYKDAEIPVVCLGLGGAL